MSGVKTDNKNNLSVAALHRLPSYLRFLKEQAAKGRQTISSVAIAERMGLNPVLVKKDLSFLATEKGKPRVGYSISGLMRDIERFLGYDNMTDAVIVGAGKLGSALISYPGIEGYGIRIVAAFDNSPDAVGKVINGRIVYPIERLLNLADRLKVRIGIITVPAAEAQRTADLLVACGIRAIWNFAPTHIVVPSGVVVQDEDIASSLAILINKLKEIT